MSLREVMLVGGGGFLGSVARYAVTQMVGTGPGTPRFPVATLVVNATGCLVIGALFGLGERTAVLTPASRTFLFVGLLGGFTTFSAFGLETMLLWRHGSGPLAAVNVGAQVIAGLLAVLLGYRLATLGAV